MAGLVTALNAARTSLEVNQKSIEVVGNNISNVNTEGYSRQKTTLTPYPAMNFGDFFIGQGVKVTDV
jgi:flagellar hook-associated protein 1 FlgK